MRIEPCTAERRSDVLDLSLRGVASRPRAVPASVYEGTGYERRPVARYFKNLAPRRGGGQS